MTQRLSEAEERTIFELIMSDFGFKEIPSSKFVKCTLCGKRMLNKGYIGAPINERMIDHFNLYHRKEK